jgi:TM2 domain-containing membrane protein YozV
MAARKRKAGKGSRGKTSKTVKRKSVARKSKPKAKRVELRRYRPSKAIAIIGLLINVLLFPGLGTIIAGRTKQGVWQIVLLGAGIILSLVYIGMALIVAAWIWGLVSSIQILQKDSI